MPRVGTVDFVVASANADSRIGYPGVTLSVFISFWSMFDKF